MLRSLRMALAGLASLPLLALPPAASAAPATVGGCYFPNVSVSIFETSFFGDITISSDPANRQAQCRDFLRGCTFTARHDSQCAASGYAAMKDAALKACKDLADPQDRTLCKKNLEADAKSFEANLDENSSGAKRECSQCYESCLVGVSCLLQE